MVSVKLLDLSTKLLLGLLTVLALRGKGGVILGGILG